MIYAQLDENRVSFLELSIDRLYHFSRAKQLFCPECRHQVFFRTVSGKTPHFYHERDSNCTYLYHEPESEEHLKGKVLLYSRLKELYPEARVEIEYRVEETNQRSDVMVIHPYGEHWAFEFQCSKISWATFMERHDLYRQAGVQDFWIFGSSVYAEYANGDYKPCSMTEAEYKIRSVLHFLDPSNQILFQVNRIRLQTKLNLDISYLHPSRMIWWNDLEEENEQKELLRQKIEQERIKQEREQERLRQQKQQERVQKEKEMKIQQARDRYRDLILQRRNFLEGLSKAEASMFLRLCRKFFLTPDNFPGFLQIRVENYNRILTPPHVWQLWVLSWCIRERADSGDFRTLKVPNIVSKFKDYVDRGVFRVRKVPDPREEPLAFPIYDFIDILNDLGYLIPFSSYKKKYFRIRSDKLQLLSDHQENIALCLVKEFYLYVPDDFHNIYSKYQNSIKPSPPKPLPVTEISSFHIPPHPHVAPKFNPLHEESALEIFVNMTQGTCNSGSSERLYDGLLHVHRGTTVYTQLSIEDCALAASYCLTVTREQSIRTWLQAIISLSSSI